MKGALSFQIINSGREFRFIAIRKDSIFWLMR